MTPLVDHSPADVLAQALIDMGIGPEGDADDESTLGNWAIGVDNLPQVPDRCILLTDTTGVVDARVFTGTIVEHYGIQILIRAEVHKEAFKKAQEVRKRISEEIVLQRVTIDSITYLIQSVSGIGPVLNVGKDTPNSKRSSCTINVLLTAQQLT